MLLDQELFPIDNPNVNGTGAIAFGGNRVFALDSNHGLFAYTINLTPSVRTTLAARIEGANVWHCFSGQEYHWNEPHVGQKYSVVLYRPTRESCARQIARRRRAQTLSLSETCLDQGDTCLDQGRQGNGALRCSSV